MPALPPLSPPDTARYTSEMLESLGKLARRQHQDLLAHLLDLARIEARTLSESDSSDPPEMT